MEERSAAWVQNCLEFSAMVEIRYLAFIGGLFTNTSHAAVSMLLLSYCDKPLLKYYMRSWLEIWWWRHLAQRHLNLSHYSYNVSPLILHDAIDLLLSRDTRKNISWNFFFTTGQVVMLHGGRRYNQSFASSLRENEKYLKLSCSSGSVMHMFCYKTSFPAFSPSIN